MRANAVVFPQPVVKIYRVLPPPREDLDDVLAIMWTGPTAPVSSDFKRVPFLVRQKEVYEALSWLKANHSDYADVTVSLDNLKQYSDTLPPVHISHLSTEDTAEPHNMAVYEDSDDAAVEDGRCPFTVHGLMGADLAQMSMEQRKQVALQHLYSGNKVLAIGTGQQPMSIYGNPKYFPAMFPWLFPYGLGGFSNEFIRSNLAPSRELHARWMLMYYDKRNKLDKHPWLDIS
ncbi:hypothetical protein PUNSTDRAFT_117025 [Punctularia strigosozonata HHB-11173 SS5]|uniref:DUF6570 domain-containing protein n=1 Tax=Punctularia strigosozonata (strain HHB-11173) TaxID=741275 RepID=R7S2E6_PUNST|nr:uncharacterized protein PUNSTDRAFT_117025 [Punctularia strigosozonata HHB-11173 SS5]EIN03421.1 hypothetical protein PUNSTDRAFT_117025 [Punctularia strigosozonata HHB-11173 SS5]